MINRKEMLFKTVTGIGKYQKHSIKVDFLEKVPWKHRESEVNMKYSA